MITKGEGKDKKNRGRRSEAQNLREQQEYWNDGERRIQETADRRQKTRGQRSEPQRTAGILE
jgi:hypothetical protein